MWSLDTDIAKKVSLLSDDDFVVLLNTALLNPYQDVEFLCTQISPDGKPLVDFAQEAEWGRQRVANATVPILPSPPFVLEVQGSSRAGFPLRVSHATQYVANRIALIG